MITIETPYNTLRCSFEACEHIVVTIETTYNTLRCPFKTCELIISTFEPPLNRAESNTFKITQVLVRTIEITVHINQSSLRVKSPASSGAPVKPFDLLL
jgi:hypothetical protein